jgi:hypothetical protein
LYQKRGETFSQRAVISNGALFESENARVRLDRSIVAPNHHAHANLISPADLVAPARFHAATRGGAALRALRLFLLN